MNFTKVLIKIFIFFIFSSSIAYSETKNLIKKNITKKTDQKIKKFSGLASERISNFTLENFKNVKYLDFGIQVQKELKPTINIMSVTELKKTESGTIFNQTSLNTHDDDETINIGFGARKLMNDNKFIFGSNIFYDHQINEGHQRIGLGGEAISSIFDLRGNFYNAISNRKINEEGNQERALDGWDIQADYHVQNKIRLTPMLELYDINLFMNAFEFKNPEHGSDHRERGNKFGANTKAGNWFFEAGYLDDNQARDAYFSNIRYIVKLGEEKNSSKNLNSLTFADVSDKLYQPVKRENKIRLVKILKSGVQVSGF